MWQCVICNREISMDEEFYPVSYVTDNGLIIEGIVFICADCSVFFKKEAAERIGNVIRV